VIDFTVNQIQQTLTHEMLICWSLLLAARGPMTLQQLSEQAGLLLSAMCGQQVSDWVCHRCVCLVILVPSMRCNLLLRMLSACWCCHAHAFAACPEACM
jgi:hypothetical protein